MLDRERTKSATPIWVGITLIAALLGLAGGMGLASTVLDSSGDSGLESALSDSKARVSQLKAEVLDLQADLEDVDSESRVLAGELAGATQREEDLGLQISQAEARASSALQALAQKQSESELLTSSEDQIATLEEQIQLLQSGGAAGQGDLESVREMSDNVERHRLLLVELRKDPPGTREETVTYWSNIKAIASKADPSLTSPADKVILKIDNFFDWNDRIPSPAIPADEYADAYFEWLADSRLSGAEAYVDATDSFTRDALLAVITQLDSVVSRLN